MEEHYFYNPLVKNKQSNDWLYIFDPRGPEVYTGDIKNAIDIVTLDKDQPAKIVGSFKYRVHRYPGDIDMLEFYEGCCTLAESKRDIVQKINEIASRIKKTRGVYLGDFKAGEDTRFKIPIGEQVGEKVVGYDRDAVVAEINELYSQKLLTKKQMNEFYKLIKSRLSLSKWLELKEAVRQLTTVRWSISELEDGKKTLVGNKTMYLRDAISQGTIVKIDIFTKINGRYTEVTNFFVLSGRSENGELVPFTEKFSDYQTSLEKEIDQRIKEGAYLKVAKRLWPLAISKKDINQLKRLFGLFSSPAAELRQMAAEAETLATMLKILRNPPIEEIRRQIDGFKLRIADISSNVLSDPLRFLLYDIIEDASVADKDKYMITKLETFEKILGEIYNTYAKVYLQAAKILTPQDVIPLLDEEKIVN